MTWELRTISDLDWVQDDSGVYTLISGKSDNEVRLDVMNASDNMPVISFDGTPDNVGKAFARWSDNEEHGFRRISIEHACYIGRELARAGIMGPDFVQD
jgi:hypothetical protein